MATWSSSVRATSIAWCIAVAIVSRLLLGASSLAATAPANTNPANAHYLSNRAPLLASQLVPLPIGAVQPEGWLRVYLERQRAGLTGNLGRISVWLQKQNNAWLSPAGKGQYGWEEVPYWLRGYIQLAYLLDDPDMIAESHGWIEAAIASQRPNGDFGPDQRFDSGARDYWANMLMLYCLQTYYEHTSDPRVIELMTRYFHYQLTVPDEQFLVEYWQHMRGGDNLLLVYWLYNHTGDAKLLELGEKLHRRTANWSQLDTLPNWHNVNIAQAFREPATFYLQSHNPLHRRASYAVHDNVRKLYGQVPGGMFGSDEVARPGYDDPRQATETCGFVEQILSDDIMLALTGDPMWGDHCEDVAFNMYPAAVMPDFRALRYLTAPNLVVSDSQNHAPGIHNRGPFLMMNPFSSRCCQHNHSMGWPYFAKHLWMATTDNGLCATVYSAARVTAKVADGTEVSIRTTTHYPFDDTLKFAITLPQATKFPLSFRIPKWCEDAELLVNDKAVDAATEPGTFARVDREWHDGDVITLRLPMQLGVRTWQRNHNSVSVDYGPLTFSLQIDEQYLRKASDETAIHDSGWQAGVDKSQWPSFEIHPTSAWNYALELSENPAESFTVERRDWPSDDFPFTLDAAPLVLRAQGRKIPEWTLDRYGLCAPLQDSPVATDQPSEPITLVPMGAARLRIASFPVAATDGQGTQWLKPQLPQPPAYKTRASHTFEGDTIDALSDGVAAAQSSNQKIPRFTWWPRRGSTEWVEYDFANEREVSSVSVLWFDDTGKGECRVPQAWRVLAKQGNEWVPVTTKETPGTTRDKFNTVAFKPLRTTALRLEVQLQQGYSGGILEWRVE